MTNLFNPKKHADQRTRLLAHARHLFAAQGIKETSMSQVAKACKVTKATLYHYFKSKDAILKEIFDCRSKDTDASIQGTKARNLEECLDQIANSYLRKIDRPENLEIMKIMISEMMKNSEMRKSNMESQKESVVLGTQSIAAFIAGKKTEKEMRLLFFQFMSTLVHYGWNIKMVGDPSDFIGAEEAFVRQLVKTYTLAFQAV